MRIINHSREEAYIKLSQNRDQALKTLEAVRDATQGPSAGRKAKYIAGERIELKRPGIEPCDDSKD